MKSDYRYPVAAMAALVFALQLLTPPAVAQEGQADHQIQPSQPADNRDPQRPELDAPSATLANHEELATQPPPVSESARPGFQAEKQGTTKPQDAIQSGTRLPQGVAAARIQPATGTAASKPAGAAIAPAKQRRVRTFLIRFGAIAGAGVAIGTVIALSSASPSKPSGTH